MYEVLVVFLLVASLLPYQASAAEPVSRLRTEGLNYAADLTSIYAGDFDAVRIARGSTDTAELVSGYRRAFSERCESALPKNKVEITNKICEREEYLENRNGEVAGSRRCVEYRAVGTGKYADPEINGLAERLQSNRKNQVLSELPKMARDPTGFITSQIATSSKASRDMDQLLVLNGCTSQATKRFQASLIGFGSGLFNPRVSERVLPHYEQTSPMYKQLSRTEFNGSQMPAAMRQARSEGVTFLECRYGSPTNNDVDIAYFWTPVLP